MSTFSAHDQRRMSLFFPPFGYLVSTSALTNSFHQLMPWRSYLLPKVDRSSVLKVTFIPRKMNVLAKIRYPGDVSRGVLPCNAQLNCRPLRISRTQNWSQPIVTQVMKWALWLSSVEMKWHRRPAPAWTNRIRYLRLQQHQCLMRLKLGCRQPIPANVNSVEFVLSINQQCHHLSETLSSQMIGQKLMVKTGTCTK